MKFRFGMPSAWAKENSTYIAVFRSTKDSQSARIRIIPGRQYTSTKFAELHFVDGSTIAFIAEVGGTSPAEITPRVRIGVLNRIATVTIDLLLDQVDEQTVDTLSQTVAMARWLTTADFLTRLRAIPAHVLHSRLHRKLNIEGTLLAALLDDASGPLDDGSEILNVLLYLKYYNDLHGFSGTNLLLDRAHTDTSRDELLSLAEDLAALSSLPLCSALRISVLDVLGHYAEANALADSVRTQVADSTIVGSESGVLSYGDLPAEAPSDAECSVSFYPVSADGLEAADARPTILFSGDSKFWKAYGPRVIFNMAALPAFSVRALIIGSRVEVERIAADLQDVQNSLHALRGSSTSPQLTIIGCNTPGDVTHSISFYASARFIFAAQYLDLFPSGLWIQDLDLYPTADISSYTRRMEGRDLGIAINSRQGGIIPWKRLLAGSVYLNPTPAAQSFIEAVSNYLRYWLVRNAAWMVDQTALSYGWRLVPELSIWDMQAGKVPLQQDTFSAAIERSVQD